jgi:signal transduction histidine kinase/CheY-like chemotaxis protein
MTGQGPSRIDRPKAAPGAVPWCGGPQRLWAIRALCVGAALAGLGCALWWLGAKLSAFFFLGAGATVGLCASWTSRALAGAARADDARLRIPIDELQEMVCVVSDQATVLSANRALEERLGRVGGLQGTGYLALFSEAGRNEASRAVQQAVQQGSALFSAEILAADGHTISVESSLSLWEEHEPNRSAEGRSSSGPLVRGREPLLVSLSRDVSDRVVLERTLAIDQTFFEKVVDVTSLAFLVYRADSGECVLSNTAALRLFDLTLGSTAWHLRESDFFKASGMLEPSEEALRTGRGSTAEVSVSARSGERVWLAIALVPFCALENHYLLVTLEDASERRRHEEQLRAAKEAAEAGTRAKGVFLANMSHEIRTPLNGILGAAELLLGTAMNESQRQLAQTLHHSADGLLSILNDILDFSKIDSGALVIDQAPFELEEVVFGVVELFRARLVGGAVDLQARIAPALPPRLLGDAGRLRQVLSNLVGNAVKFTSRGTVRIDATPAALDGRSALCLSVADSGIGISEAQLDRLFKAFSQGDASTARRFGGTGLGLAICKALTEAMGGRIAVRSEPGRGATFTVVIPLAVALEQSPRSRSWAGRRALVVEPDLPWREILMEQLTSLGFAVAEGDASRPVLEADAILCDQASGQVPGLQFKTRALLFLAPVTARLHELARTERGIILQKPIRLSTLASSIAMALGESGEPTTAAVNSQIQEQAGQRPSCRVLLAEDNPVNQLIAQKMLAKLGATVVLASNGREAVERAAAERFDLVLMDCQMPEMDGYEAAMAIRARESKEGGRTAIVALTASALAEDRERSFASGMDDHVSKPVALSDLRRVLTRVSSCRASTASVGSEGREREMERS